jgi:spectinomycin phosphotransferase
VASARVRAPPPDLETDLVRAALERHWGIRPPDLAYLPVGFGDHHWLAHAGAERCFVTVRDLRLDGRGGHTRHAVATLERTFRAVRRLKDLAGLPFIVPAVPSTSGALVVPVGRCFALSVYDWIDVHPLRDTTGVVAAGLVARLHRASREHPVRAVAEDFGIPHCSALEDALGDLGRPWPDGPFGEPARALLASHQGEVRAALALYDELAGAAGADATWCLTHGEPSGDNLVQDEAGAPLLVDWESARLAPPERDLARLEPSDRTLARYLEVAGGTPPQPDLVRLYRLWYDLAETAVYLLQFRAPHTADDNLVESWRNFRTYLPTAERRPELRSRSENEGPV